MYMYIYISTCESICIMRKSDSHFCLVRNQVKIPEFCTTSHPFAANVWDSKPLELELVMAASELCLLLQCRWTASPGNLHGPLKFHFCPCPPTSQSNPSTNAWFCSKRKGRTVTGLDLLHSVFRPICLPLEVCFGPQNLFGGMRCGLPVVSC